MQTTPPSLKVLRGDMKQLPPVGLMNYTRSTPEKREGIRSVLMDPIKKKRKGEGACTKLDFSTIKSTEGGLGDLEIVPDEGYDEWSERMQLEMQRDDALRQVSRLRGEDLEKCSEDELFQLAKALKAASAKVDAQRSRLRTAKIVAAKAMRSP